MREKRTAQIRANIFPSTKAELEQVLAEEGKVISLSDWLFETVEEKLAMRRAIRISKQRIGRRIGQQ
jgi:hypothetical protein